MTLIAIITTLILIPTLVGLMKIFEKAGYKSYFALIPFYNAYIWLKVIEKPIWWIIFAFLPYINVFMFFLFIVETAKTFNKNLLWEQALAAVFPFAYIPYLGFSKDEKYQIKSQRPEFKKTKVREWTDAIVFAVFAATIIRTFIFEAYTIPTPSMEKSMLVGDYLFVSKLSFGPKVPNTPIAFPFVHHTMPLSATAKSYVEWIKLPYYRFGGFREIKNNDIVVFNYPDGDTVSLNHQNQSYYTLVRRFGWSMVNTPTAINPQTQIPFGPVVARPVDKRENYIKRCIGIAGDSLQIINQDVYINGKKAETKEGYQTQYFIVGKNNSLTGNELQELGLSMEEIETYYNFARSDNYRNEMLNYYLPYSTCDSAFTKEQIGRLSVINISNEVYAKLKNHPNVERLVKLTFKKGIVSDDIFPYDGINYPWNQDNFGPIYIPKAGASIEINLTNLPLYRRIIEKYENNSLQILNNQILINNKPATHYTFKMNYYWMMGDNRHNSADSRYWGFVPEDHIVGSPAFIWLSMDKDRSITNGKIRFSRMFSIPN